MIAKSEIPIWSHDRGTNDPVPAGLMLKLISRVQKLR